MKARTALICGAIIGTCATALVKGLKEKRIRRPPPPEEGARVKRSENPRSGAYDD